MIYPVSSSSTLYQAEIPQPTQDIPKVEEQLAPKKVEDPLLISLQDEYNELDRRYYDVCREAYRCGYLAQHTIDIAYGWLTEFAERHPEFKAQLPKKAIGKWLEGASGLSLQAERDMLKYR